MLLLPAWVLYAARSHDACFKYLAELNSKKDLVTTTLLIIEVHIICREVVFITIFVLQKHDSVHCSPGQSLLAVEAE